MPVGTDLNPVIRVPIVGLLAWIVPGLGHFFIGERVRGLIYLVTITVTFWGGVAIGGVCDTVNRQERTAWFMAQSCTGVYALTAHFWGQHLGRGDKDKLPPECRAHWMSAETGVVYAGVAGLLNILVILDALARADLRSVVPTTVSARTRKGVP